MKSAGDSVSSVAERIVSAELRGATSHEDATKGLERCCDKLRRALAPVLGDAGFNALLGRSFKRIAPRFSSAAAPATSGPSKIAEDLCAWAGQHDPAQVAEICVALLTELFRLLETLIGEDLTATLLEDAWPEAVAGELDGTEKQ